MTPIENPLRLHEAVARAAWALMVTILSMTLSASATAQPVPGGTLDPLTIPKYVTPLVIPPVMEDAAGDNSTSDYDIAVREFQQQILPGGHWNALSPACAATPGLCSLPATTVWSYGPAADPLPDSSGIPGGAAGLAPAPNSQFNYPAYTVENEKDQPTTVDWINGLKENFGAGPDYLEHLLPIDQTLHWANPGADCIMGDPRTDCRGQSQAVYTGPVPIVTHVHGAHVGPESDGYPEAWWLPAPGDDFECVTDPADADNTTKFVCQGSLANGYGYTPNTNVTPGVANYSYANDQPSTTLWYHDHTLGMTRNNVYAGPAGFWLIRDGGGETGLLGGTLPAPAPAAQEGLAETNLTPGRHKYREIPIVIQDRSFNADGSLFYPANRAVFEGLLDSLGGNIPSILGNDDAGLFIDFIPDSDIAPIWNPEAFFNVMVVNGVSWPELEVAPAIYRFRLLNGCNSRFLNLSLQQITGQGRVVREIPVYQIGAEQSLLPQVVRIETGYATPLPGDGSDVDPRRPDCLKANGKLQNKCVPAQPAPFAEQALLMALAERADVLVDFRALKDGDVVRMINTAPDAPFGGFPDIPADPATSGQVMQFRVNSALLGQSPTDPTGLTPATDPASVALSPVEAVDTYVASEDGLVVRDLALIEEESEDVCVLADALTEEFIVPIEQVDCDMAPPAGQIVVPFGPKAAVLGIDGANGGSATLWSDLIETNPELHATEVWELYNYTMDSHPIHLHLVKFKVLGRQQIDATGNKIAGTASPPEADETGWKDTVIAYPGEVTRVAATFDIEGLYVWHCHIVEHEDNEMMVPYCVGDPEANGCAGLVAAP